MAEFTPGPWQIGKVDGKCVGRIIFRDDGPGKNYARICRNVENDADANLIAAAPDLLAACERMLTFEKWKDVLHDLNWATSYLDAMKMLRDAVTKARGK